MEIYTLIMVSITTMLANVTLCYMLWRVIQKQQADDKAAHEELEKTQEQLEEEKKLREEREYKDRGFQNMMDYDGSPERSDG